MRTYANVAMTVLVLGLFGWMMVLYYQASVNITSFVGGEREFVFEINLTPLVLLIILALLFTFITNQKKKKKNWTKALLLPGEFPEDDERERLISSQACRAAYVSMWYTFPIITAMLLLYPFVEDSVPFYPVLIFLLLPLVQVISYLIKWRKLF